MIRNLATCLLLATSGATAENAADALAAAGVTEFRAACQAWDGQRFGAAADKVRRATRCPDASALTFYWLGVVEFHRMLHLESPAGGAPRTALAAAAREEAVRALRQALQRDPTNAECHALLGTLHGMKIAGNVLRAAWFGPRIQRHQRTALAHGPDNPRVQYLLGACQFHTAKGSTERRQALATLLAAERLFAAEAERPATPLEPRWGYSSCLTFIGRTYELLEQPRHAADYFHKSLAQQPSDHLARAGLARVTRDL